ncbi:MAG: tetratricopeptide repeat protein [Myxococcaceae bacterium]|nr:tetratricopeptide repeat protein [Myxococcaceae bacterium]
MSKSMVERYEQMLRQDPASTVFVELAKAFLERGDHARAIEVCQQGVGHHPKSVVGRVLWGKALISLGKASEAMNQFDQAVGLDRDNPHAYNLIGEVLLKKGLYRSALPVLRKAAALQPNDGRIKQWLDQTKSALTGGPAPAVADSTLLEQATEGPPPGSTVVDEHTSQMPIVQGAQTTTMRPPREVLGDEVDGQPTVVTNAYDPNQARPSQPSQPGRTVVPDDDEDDAATQSNVVPPAARAAAAAAATSALEEGRSSATQELPLVAGTLEKPPPPALGDEPDPFSNVPKRTTSSDALRGMTTTFDALTAGAVPASANAFAAFADAPKSPPPPPKPSAPPDSEPTVVPSADLVREARAAVAEKERGGGQPLGLLGDVASLTDHGAVKAKAAAPTPVPAPAPAKAAAKAPPPPVLQPGGRRPLLEDIPDALEPSSSLEVPKVDVNPQAAEAIAKEYERELREKLHAKQQKKTFLQRNGLKLAVALGALVVVGGLTGSFLYTRWRHSGKDLATALAEGRTAIGADTQEEYRHALELLAVAESMDSSSAEVWALKATAAAALYSEYGQKAEDKALAVSALSRSGVRDGFPELALIADTWLSGTPAAKKALIDSQLDKSEVQAEAGRYLLEEKKPDEAFKRLERAVSLLPTNMRALSALGDYYLSQEDPENALKLVTGQVAQLSPKHAQRVIVAGQARLELGQELAQGLAEVEALPPVEQLPQALRARALLVHGRLLSAAGRHAEALAMLAAAQKSAPERGLEMDLALGAAQKAAGQMEAAGKSYEAALKKDPKSEVAREGLGRVYLARSREKELIADKRLQAGGRKSALVRGIAYVRLGDAKNARAELAKTKVEDKIPAEAAIYLALADAQEEGPDRAVQILEKLLGTLKKNRATVQIALARVYMQKSQLTKAMELLEQASKDPNDFEASALFGELSLQAEEYDAAIAALSLAVERNGSHAPSRKLLTRTLLHRGKLADALKQAEAWVEDNPGSEDAQRAYGTALFYAGKYKEAEAALNKAKGLPEDVESWRTRARVQFALGDQRGAMKSLEASNKLDSKDADTFCEIGAAFVRQGVPDAAMAAYEAAKRENPKAACGKIGPHFARPFGGKPAIKELEGLIASPTISSYDEGIALAAMARVQLNAGLLKEARASAEKATQEQPAIGAGWYALGLVAQKQKDEALALEALGKAVAADAASEPYRLAYADQLAKGDDEAVKRALNEYQWVLSLSQNEGDSARVKRTIPLLQKRLQK